MRRHTIPLRLFERETQEPMPWGQLDSCDDCNAVGQVGEDLHWDARSLAILCADCRDARAVCRSSARNEG